MDALSAIGCSAKAISAEGVGRLPGSYVDWVAQNLQRTWPTVVIMASWAEGDLSSGDSGNRFRHHYLLQAGQLGPQAQGTRAAEGSTVYSSEQ